MLTFSPDRYRVYKAAFREERVEPLCKRKNISRSSKKFAKPFKDTARTREALGSCRRVRWLRCQVFRNDCFQRVRRQAVIATTQIGEFGAGKGAGNYPRVFAKDRNPSGVEEVER